MLALTEKVGKKGKGGGEAHSISLGTRRRHASMHHDQGDIPLELRASRECVSGSLRAGSTRSEERRVGKECVP